MYEEFLKLIKKSKEALSVSDIYAHFEKQPFGSKLGILPILLAVFFKSNESSCAFYNQDEQGKESFDHRF